jgi:hypothetical protein
MNGACIVCRESKIFSQFYLHFRTRPSPCVREKSIARKVWFMFLLPIFVHFSSILAIFWIQCFEINFILEIRISYLFYINYSP